MPRKTAAVGRGSVFAATASCLLWLVVAVPSCLRAEPSADDNPAPQAEPISKLPPPPAARPGETALGGLLFADARLSGDGRRACTSCHDLQRNGAIGGGYRVRSPMSGIPFRTLSVFNVGLRYRLGWEGRFRSLEEQAAATLTSASAMATTREAVVAAVAGDSDLRRRFRSVYGREPNWDDVIAAIAAFERSLLTPGSRFDRWLGGDSGALTSRERHGYLLFKSFGCVSCHQGVSIGANLMERSGVFHDLAANQSPMLRVPSLRNVAVMAPYFHDGSAPTLARAVETMGWTQLNRRLSGEEVEDIVAFLGTLTGTFQGRQLLPNQ